MSESTVKTTSRGPLRSTLGRLPLALARALACVALGLLSLAPVASAQAFPSLQDEAAAAGPASVEAPEVGAALAASLVGQGDTEPTAISGEDGRLSTAVEIAVLLTALSLLPAVLITLTSFTRIVIVLSFVRRALSLNELPPNQILIGLALFLTMFVMAPVGKELYAEAWTPYEAGDISIEDATGRAWGTMSTFLVANTRENELRLFAELADSAETVAFLENDPQEGFTDDGIALGGAVETSDLPLTVVIPAFILSELKTAFQMGFLLFLPFLVIDLVVSSILLSMGMFMLPPVMISTPIKVLIFVLVDGWRLVTESVVTSFVQTIGA